MASRQDSPQTVHAEIRQTRRCVLVSHEHLDEDEDGATAAASDDDDDDDDDDGDDGDGFSQSTRPVVESEIDDDMMTCCLSCSVKRDDQHDYFT